MTAIDTAGELARLLLTGMLGVAAVGKLADLRGGARTVRGFGVPPTMVWPVAIALPPVELALAAGLVVDETARASAVAAACLLTLFAALIAFKAIRGEHADCGCFGRLHSSRAGFPTAVRNGALALVALWLAFETGGSMPWRDVTIVVTTSAAIGGGILCLVLLRRYGRALRRIDELEGGAVAKMEPLGAGSIAPPFVLPTVSGQTFALGDLLGLGRPVLAVFVAPECGPCRALLSELSDAQRELGSRLTFAVVSSGGAEASRALATEHQLGTLLVQDGHHLSDAYGVTATPSAFLIGRDGRLMSPITQGASAIRELLEPYKGVRSPQAATASPAEPRRRTTAAAVAAGAALAVPVAHATVHERAAESPADPELEAFRDVLEGASPGLAKAARRSSEAIRKTAVVRGGSAARARRAAAAKALEAERVAVLGLHARLEQLPATSTRAHNVKVTALRGLSLLAQSLGTRKRAVVAAPAARVGLINASERLLLRSLDVIATSARLMAGG